MRVEWQLINGFWAVQWICTLCSSSCRQLRAVGFERRQEHLKIFEKKSEVCFRERTLDILELEEPWIINETQECVISVIQHGAYLVNIAYKIQPISCPLQQWSVISATKKLYLNIWSDNEHSLRTMSHPCINSLDPHNSPMRQPVLSPHFTDKEIVAQRHETWS